MIRDNSEAMVLYLYIVVGHKDIRATRLPNKTLQILEI